MYYLSLALVLRTVWDGMEMVVKSRYGMLTSVDDSITAMDGSELCMMIVRIVVSTSKDLG